MLARLQQFTTLGLISTAAVCAALLAAQGRYAWALIVSGVTIFAHAIILAIEFVVLIVVNGDDPAPAATTRQLVKAWWGEVLTTPEVFCWQQPFRSTTQPDHLPHSVAGKTGIVFVHGLVCNRGLWNPWLSRLRQLDIPFVAVNLEPRSSTLWSRFRRFPAITSFQIKDLQAHGGNLCSGT
jgi:triacylglycerol lipase